MLSENQLNTLMHILKESLTFFDRECSKVAFFNDWCLYRHIREFSILRTKGKKNFSADIGEILDTLEPYIPFRLTEENFDLFMESVFSDNQEVEPRFAHKAKFDFVMFLRGIRDQETWQQTLAVCEAIRGVKEELSEVKMELSI